MRISTLGRLWRGPFLKPALYLSFRVVWLHIRVCSLGLGCWIHQLAGQAPGSRDVTSYLGESCMDDTSVLDVLESEVRGIVLCGL